MQIARAVLQTVASRQVGLLASMASMLVLARLLTPEAFGAYALAFSLFAILEELAIFGLEAGLVKAKAFTKEQAGNAAGFGVVLAAAFAGLAGMAAWLAAGTGFAAEALLLFVLSAALLFRPLTLPAEAALSHGVRFGLLSVAAAAMLVVEAGAAIFFALQGLGAMSLALGVVCGRLVKSLLLAGLARRHLVRPAFSNPRGFLRFGSAYSAANLVPKISGAVTTAAVSSQLGAAALGFYDRAQMVTGLLDRTVLDGLKPVVLPAISRSLEAGHASADIYLRKVALLSVLIWPVYAGIFILAEPLVGTLLGKQWGEVVLPLRILCLGGIAVPFTRMSVKLFTAIDDLGTLLRIQNAMVTLRMVTIIPAAMISLEAVCSLVTLSLFVRGVAITRAIKPKVAYETRGLMGSILPSAANAGAVAAGAWLTARLTEGQADPFRLGAGLMVCLVLWVGMVGLLRHPILFSALELLRSRPVRA